MASGRKTGGRKAGVPNKATADVKAAARKYTTDALKTLAAIMHDSESDPARVAAAKELLDRGHGKSAQAIVGGAAEDNPIRVIAEIRRTIVEPGQ